jgi:hypothetical protein
MPREGASSTNLLQLRRLSFKIAVWGYACKGLYDHGHSPVLLLIEFGLPIARTHMYFLASIV